MRPGLSAAFPLAPHGGSGRARPLYGCGAGQMVDCAQERARLGDEGLCSSYHRSTGCNFRSDAIRSTAAPTVRTSWK